MAVDNIARGMAASAAGGSGEAEKKAEQALAAAAAAQETADTAEGKADAAQTAAEGAQTAADGAQATANTAKGEAEAAQAAAGKAQTAADNAQTTADSAQTAAGKAQTAADTAQADADAAAAAATAAQDSADKAQETADTAISKTDALYKLHIGTDTTAAFESWWSASDASLPRYDRLSAWFSLMAEAWADKTYTLRWNLPENSTDPAMTQMDDLVGKSAAALATDLDDGGDDWAENDPMTWYVRANANSLADGTMEVTAVEGVDDGFDISGESAPVYTFSIALWLKEWADESYNYISWRTTQADGYYPYAGDVAPDNTKRALTWHPTFGGALDSQGRLTSGAGLPPFIGVFSVNASATTGNTKAKLRNAYEGLWNDCDTKWLLDMWQLRHFNLENSGILEGCTSYSVDYAPALAETGVERVLVTTSQAASYIVGSCVSLSTTSRGGTATFAQKKIKSIETVEIDGTSYGAINIDNGGVTFDTTTALHLASMPWWRGSTEVVPGHKDGCRTSLTSGKYPARIAGIEVLDGAYAVSLEPLYNVTKNADGTTFDYAIYQCLDSEKLASSITANYENTGLGKEAIVSGWQYVTAFIRTKLGVLFPDRFDGSSSSGYKSAFYRARSAGVRCPWRFGTLNYWGDAGLACETGDNSPGASDWTESPRLAGAGKKRGEWAG